MTPLSELAIVALSIAVLDWAARWQVENAFVAFLKINSHIRIIDLVRIVIFVGMFLSSAAIIFHLYSEVATVVGIALVLAYFGRLIRDGLNACREQ
jgi:hypothetical protein